MNNWFSEGGNRKKYKYTSGILYIAGFTLLLLVCAASVKTYQAGMIALGIFLTYSAIFLAVFQNRELRKEKEKLDASQAKLKENETLFRAIFEQATIGISIGHNDKYYLLDGTNEPSINPMFERITGRSREEFACISWMDMTHPEDLEKDLRKFKQLREGLIDTYEMEKRYIKPDGSLTWINMMVSRLKLEGSTDFYHLCLATDINREKEIQQELYQSENNKSNFLENLPGMAYRCNYDREWTMRYVSRGCIDLTGYQPESILDNLELSYNDLILPHYRDYLWEKWFQVLQDKSQLREEYEIRTASGEIKWVYEQGHPVYDTNDKVEALEGIIIDITRRKEQELKLKYMNEHNSLSGLYNRRYFEAIMESGSSSCDAVRKALILVNIRKFNKINLTYGYYQGERLIQAMADMLMAICGADYELFHISTDRFVILVRDYQEAADLSALCESILQGVQNIQVVSNFQINMGILELHDMTMSVEHILKFASIAAENANKSQTLDYCFFSHEMEKSVLYKEIIKEELTELSISDQDSNLFLVYQPIVDLRTNKVYGFEALARFHSDRLGSVSPNVFIPIAEEEGLIVPLGNKIIQQALRFLKQLEEEGLIGITLSVNVSAVQLLREDFVEGLDGYIKEAAVNPHNLNIELTETVFSNDYEELNRILDQISDRGIKVSIDDFGTGYSSLARERELNINCLKIDKYFIDKLLSLDGKEAIVGDIISMAHKLGQEVVAEGVEYESQKQYLTEHSCDYMQGYLFSKPVSMEKAIELILHTNFISET